MCINSIIKYIKGLLQNTTAPAEFNLQETINPFNQIPDKPIQNRVEPDPALKAQTDKNSVAFAIFQQAR